MNCKNCGAEIKEGFLFCMNCGTKVETADEKAESAEINSEADLDQPSCEPESEIGEEAFEKTAEYVASEMTSPEGGFYSSQDADSEGEEGKYYTFTPNEIIDLLGREKGGVIL
mgnify:CR=1 FL=1